MWNWLLQQGKNNLIIPFLSPPLVPDADEARALAEAELAKATYDNSPTLWDAIVGWFRDVLDLIFRSIGDGGTSTILAITLGVVAVIVIVLLLRIRNTRSVRQRFGASPIFSHDDARSPERIRADAKVAADRGEWGAATIERFRAMIRAMVQRTIILEDQGLTAQEAVRIMQQAFPESASELTMASQIFDDLFYGHRPGDQDTYVAMVELDATIERTTPQFAGSGSQSGHQIGEQVPR